MIHNWLGSHSLLFSQKEPVTEGTVKPSTGFNAENDAGVLRKAMKGFGKTIMSSLKDSLTVLTMHQCYIHC